MVSEWAKVQVIAKSRNYAVETFGDCSVKLKMHAFERSRVGSKITIPGFLGMVQYDIFSYGIFRFLEYEVRLNTKKKQNSC